MSTAPAGTPPDPPLAQPGQMPGPWALLAATAVGGVIGTRLGPTPLVLAAGAAALALLQQKKSAATASSSPGQQQSSAESLPAGLPVDLSQPGFVAGPTPGTGWYEAPTLPAPPPQSHDSMQSQVEAWLSRQMQREKEEPVIELGLNGQDAASAPVSSAAPPPAGDVFFSTSVAMNVAQGAGPPANTVSASAEDDYRPGPFLLDEAEGPPGPAEARLSHNHNAFAQLTAPRDMYVELEPVPQQEPPAGEAALPLLPPLSLNVKPPLAEPAKATPAYFFAAPAPPSVQSNAAANATRPLNLEPLPSLTEPAPHMLPVGALFFSSPPPLPQVEREPQPMAAPPPEPSQAAPAQVFEGEAFPDEIEVPMAFGVDDIPAVLFKEKAPSTEDAPASPGQPPHATVAMPFFNSVEHIREIEVQLASPGDASFDTPLAAAPHDPWQVQMEASTAGTRTVPELDAETGLLTARAASPGMMPGSPFWDAAAMDAAAQPEAPASVHALPTGPVVDAELVIKPRPPDTTRPVFVAKPRPLAPSFAVPSQDAPQNTPLHLQPHSHPHAGMHGTQDLPAPLESAQETESPFLNPLQAPRPHTRRSSRHSWWEGD